MIRKDQTMKQNVKCPYLQNGICYHKSCIYIPKLDCMKKRDYDKFIATAHKIVRNAIKHVKTAKKGDKR